MQADTCFLCHGLRGHKRLKDTYCKLFENEYNQAKMECDRLKALWNDVCWYNFELKCQLWKHPWPESIQESFVELHGYRVCNYTTTDGRTYEKGEFPEYYSGPLHDAPPLPAQIVLHELSSALAYLTSCQEQISAPHDWAPGGIRYEELRKYTAVPTEFSVKKSEAYLEAQSISKRLCTRNDGSQCGKCVFVGGQTTKK